MKTKLNKNTGRSIDIKPIMCIDNQPGFSDKSNVVHVGDTFGRIPDVMSVEQTVKDLQLAGIKTITIVDINNL